MNRASFASLLSLAAVMALSSSSAGCTASTGATCEVTADCSGGLVCCTDGLPRGTCQASCPEVPDSGAADAALDALSSMPDAFSSTTPDAFELSDAPASDAPAPDDAGTDGGS